MADSFRSRNFVAVALLVVGKVLGIIGLVVGSKHRAVGGTLLALDAVLIFAAVGYALRTMRARERADDGQKDILRQMKRDGTLEQYLRDLAAEDGATTRDDADSKRDSG